RFGRLPAGGGVSGGHGQPSRTSAAALCAARRAFWRRTPGLRTRSRRPRQGGPPPTPRGRGCLVGQGPARGGRPQGGGVWDVLGGGPRPGAGPPDPLFARRILNLTDTIVAISTPGGRGGLGVVRLSGGRAPVSAARMVRFAGAPDW